MTMANRLESLQFLLRDAEGVATLAAVINGRIDLQQTLILMCPAFQKPAVPTLMPSFGSPAPMQHMVMPLSPGGPYMNTFPSQVPPPLTPNSSMTGTNLNTNFATPMPVCPKCHHSYGPERMAVHVKVCGGTLDRSDGLRSPTPNNMGRSLSSNNLEQLNQDSEDGSTGRGYAQPVAKGAYAAKDEQPIGGARRRSVHEPSDSFNASAYAAKDDKPVGGGAGRGTGAYAAKDDQPIGGGARGGGAYAAKDDTPIGGGRYAAKDDQPVGGGAPRAGTGAYAAKDEQPIGSARRRSVKEEQPIVFDEPNRGGARAGTGAYAAKDDQPIGGRAGTGAYAAKDDQPIGGRPGTGAYAAKDDQPIGGRAGTGAYAAKDEQPIGGTRRRSVKEEQPLSFPEPAVAASPARRRSVKEEQPLFEENRGAGAYLAKDEKPVGGGRAAGNPFPDPAAAAAPIRRRSVKEEQPPLVEPPIANTRRRSVKEEQPPFAARDDAGEEGGSRRGSLSEAGIDEDGDDDDGRRPRAGTGGYLAKDDKPVGHAAEVFDETPDQEEARVACPKCSRQFASSRIDKHIKACKVDPNAPPEEKPEPKLAPKPTPVKSREPSPAPNDGGKKKSFAERQLEALEAKFQACAKCGRKFAPDRIAKHESVCKGAKKADEDEEPVKEEPPPPPVERTPKKAAPAPPALNPDGTKRKTFAERQMEAMEAKFVACGKCGRKFAPDRIEKHEGVCKGEKPLTRATEEPEVTCNFCKRKFAKDALEAHEIVCQVLLLDDEVSLTPQQAKKGVPKTPR